ncbi:MULTISPECIES: MarR family winged helix-turn-helix transcriptional regulator [unclassified Methanobrevibacter]|uniref:MarR family winged helix-turn-helix transcriptional regulator n=1 Tax=unclassified Methanobrevibacter TaxID=2638681 RepID=UPI0025F36E3E|nr:MULTISPECIES: MarR family transcriptional regulator [unclassified Methanobrevibacter]MEE0941917.1 MarR family transcriptional regulator [Methanobrevibacter sp.]
MPFEEIKQMDATQIPVGKLLYMIGKGYSVYVNRNLEEFGINTTQLHLLFEIAHESNINQEMIAARCNINKGAVARSIRKLEEKGLVKREIDENNRRQNRLSLTKDGEDILIKACGVLRDWEDSVILDDGYIKKELLQKVLKEIAVKTMELNEGE